MKEQGGNYKSREFVIGAIETVQDLLVVTSTFLIIDLYANILFDTGADRSYITPKLRKLLNNPSSKLRKPIE